MGNKQQTTESFKEKVFKKHEDKVEILSEYNGGTEPIDFIYRCEIHGDTRKTLNAKNILAKCFSPCKQCTSTSQSESGRDVRKKIQNFSMKDLKIIVNLKVEH